ncbi:MAG: bifunctional methylenetetrahydrofolate dehydrogenase/methenyltetrahydrofolate cyclohydrolase FolD [Clostridiales bacterium]|nr:bifunctional methylenetetrahydrofolate dehydrogenase/methenyltetrahydrofolate cyclohydrolase FolD [Clostridiales bacterium]
MAARILDGKKISAAVREDIKARAAALTERTGIVPGLAVILVGENPASQVYVRNKKKACEEAGFYSVVITMPADTAQETLLEMIEELKADRQIHGILVQLPLPPQIDEQAVIAAIPPEKDVDAFHPENVGHIMIGDHRFLPCTPAGVMKMLEIEDIPVAGRECVVIGRSNIVGKPMAMLLLQANGTVTICHSKTKNLPEVTRRADILVSAVGKAGFVTADMVKPGAVVIDVGMNRNAEGKLCGDVDFPAVSEIASAITPVPGGVGVMTITMLLENTLRAASGDAPAGK